MIRLTTEFSAKLSLSFFIIIEKYIRTKMMKIKLNCDL